MDRSYRYLYIVSCLMLVSGAALGIVGHVVFDVIYLLGALGYGLYYLLIPAQGLGVRMRRLVRMNVFAALLFLLSGSNRLGAFSQYGQQLWIVLLLLGLIFMVYANVVIGRGQNSETNKNS